MAEGSVQVRVVLTDRAKADYASITNRAVASLRDGQLVHKHSALIHFSRARRILRSLKDPSGAKSDQPMINEFSWMLSRSEETTYIYFGRNAVTGTVVVIHICEGTTDIYRLLADIVFSGKTEILTALGIIPPPIQPSRPITIQ